MYGNYGNEGQGFGGPRRSFAPVNVGDELDVKIEAVGEKGDGICKKDGFVLFVPGVKEGQEVKIRITKVLRKVGFAEVVSGEGGETAAPTEEAPAEEAEEVAEEEPNSEDTEDFGEEAPAKEEATEEEATEEEATEEEATEEEATEEEATEEEAPAEEATEEEATEEEKKEE